ncbi:MAG: type II secretion system F family protein [Bacillaceae bacterium]|nr:type II secretion system F family protein [Bacillaceae bacterium]
MLAFLFFILTVVCFVLLIAGVLLSINKGKIAVQNRMDAYFVTQSQVAATLDIDLKQEAKKQGVLHRYWKIGVHYVSDKLSSSEQKKLDMLLRDAGLSAKMTAVEFRLLQLLISIGAALVVTLLFVPAADNKMMGWLMAGAVAFLGIRLPLFFLAKKKTERIQVINKDMSDFFDTVNLLLEAGVGLDSAIKTVCEKNKGPLAEEFLIALDEMKRGKSRREAFYELRKRVPSDSFQSIITALIQSDQLGIGMAKALRNLTVRVREQRREAAREKAMKAPVKMLFPMLFFIFPALFIVILGPLVIMLLTKGLGGEF